MQSFINTLRIRETFLMTGFFLIAVVFATEALEVKLLPLISKVFVIVFFLILSVYSFNAYCGKKHDAINERLAFLHSASSSSLLFFSVLFFTLSVAITAIVNIDLLWFLLIIYGLWVLYPLPRAGLKNFPFSGTFLHFVAQVIHFNMVYAFFAIPDKYSLLLSFYFAILFSGGHVHHEIIDFEADKKAGLNTATVKFGIRKMSLFSISMFSINTLYLLFLSFWDLIDFVYILPLLLAFIFQLSFFLNNYMLFDEYKVRLKYQKNYRMAYFTGCVFIILLKLFI